MLDMGFLPDVRRIVSKCDPTAKRCSSPATLPPEIERLAATVLQEPETIEIGAPAFARGNRHPRGLSRGRRQKFRSPHSPAGADEFTTAR